MSADVTEHRTVEGKVYCRAIKGVFSNRIVGYNVRDRMTAQVAMSARRTAIARRQPRRTVVVHSDRLSLVSSARERSGRWCAPRS